MIITASRYVKSDYFTMVAEEEKYEGVWWTANCTQNKIPGSLHITSQGISLALNGCLGNSQEFCYQGICYYLILGIQSNGYQFTLEKCVETRNQFPIGDGYSTQTFSVNQVYGGIHVNCLDELKFNEYNVNYTYLKEWLRDVGLDFPKRNGSGFFIGYDPNRATTIPKLGAKLDDVSIEIISEPVIYTKDNVRESGVKIQETVTIRCNSPISVKDLSIKILEPLRGFLTLATAVPNSVTSLSATLGEESDVRIYAQSPYPAQPAFSLFNERIILFHANFVASNLSHYLNKWLELEQEMRDVCELFFGVHYDQGAFATNRLLNSVQALEAYSRFRYGRYSEPKEVHKQRVKAILEAAPDEYKKWLETTLSYANNKSLKIRLIELVKKARPLANELIPNPEEFARGVVDTRNYLTHRDRKGKKRIVKEDHLDSMIHSLIWLLRIHFLFELGFGKEECSELLSKNKVYTSLCSYVSSEAPWGNISDQ